MGNSHTLVQCQNSPHITVHNILVKIHSRPECAAFDQRAKGQWVHAIVALENQPKCTNNLPGKGAEATVRGQQLSYL